MNDNGLEALKIIKQIQGEVMIRYNKWNEEKETRDREMVKLDKFLEMICKGKEVHEIKNELAYYISVVWDISYTHRKADKEYMELDNE